MYCWQSWLTSDLLLTRLLRAMGWKENDDDNSGYEITEDDVREFEDLCRQMKLNKVSIVVMLFCQVTLLVINCRILLHWWKAECIKQWSGVCLSLFPISILEVIHQGATQYAASYVLTLMFQGLIACLFLNV